MIRIFVQTLCFFRFEVEWILADEPRRIGPALHSNRSAPVMKQSLARAELVSRVIGLQVLRHVIQLYMPARDRDFRLAVVLDVVGMEPCVFVNNVPVAVAV